MGCLLLQKATKMSADADVAAPPLQKAIKMSADADAVNLDEIDSFFNGLDASMLGDDGFQPQRPPQPPAPHMSSFQVTLDDGEERKPAAASGYGSTKRGSIFEPENSNGGSGSSEGIGSENEIISRLMSQLTMKDLRIASLATENESLRSELSECSRSLAASPSTSSSSGSPRNSRGGGNSGSGSLVSTPTVEKPQSRSSSGFSGSKTRINARLHSLGFDASSKTVESMLSDLMLDGQGGITASTSLDPLDPLLALGNASAARFDATQSMSEMALVGSTNLLLTEQQKEHVEERRNAEMKARLAGRTPFYSSPARRERKDDAEDGEGGEGEGDPPCEDDTGGRGARNSNSSTDSEETRLFRDTESTPENKAKADQPNTEMSYQEFLDRLMQSECEVLVGVIRRFLASVLGPSCDGVTPPGPTAKVDYIFYGTEHLARRCADFFSAMHEHFLAHPSWRIESEERLLSAGDCLEKYVMSRIAALAFHSTEVTKEDEQLSRRMQLLRFLRPEALEIQSEQHNELIWALARDELRKINSYKTPGEKIACVVKCASVIFRSLSMSQIKTGADQDGGCGGADDFLPIFIWVVLRSNVPKLFSNVEYIQAFHSPRRLMGRSGYCFVNLSSALNFIMNLDADSVSGMDADEFHRCLKEEERFLNGGF